MVLMFGVTFVTPNIVNATQGAADDLFVLYESEIHAKETGVYEQNGWVFFHDRAEVKDEGRFRKQKASQAALKSLTKAVFDWIDARVPQTSSLGDKDESVMMRLGAAYVTPKTAVQRRLAGLDVRILYRDLEKGDDKVFVMDLAFKKSDLLKDADKGRFESRRETVEQQWRNVVRDQLAGKNRMAFLRDAGAYDLWTIDSCKTSGMKELCLTNSEAQACCQRCISDLSKCAAKPKSLAAKEYADLLSDMYGRLSNEVFSAKWVAESPRLKVMLLSFASCPTARQDVPDDGWDVLAAYADQQKPADETCEAIALLLSKSPGSEELWRVLGKALARMKCWNSAASCYRNALRLKPDDVETIDLMAKNYGNMGMDGLSKGCALIAFGMAQKPEDCTESNKILGLVK